MELSKQKRILFVPDCINGLDSGAQSARATLRYLCSLGHTVAVYTKDALVAVQDEVKNDAAALYAVPTAMRWYEFISAPKLRRHFISVVDEFQPNYVFFVGSIQKPAPLAKAARRRSIKTVYLFYINDFFVRGSMLDWLMDLVFDAIQVGRCQHSPKAALACGGCRFG